MMNEIWPDSYEKLISFAAEGLTNSRYVSEENHCKHIAVNRDKNIVYHIKVDGNVIPKSYNKTKRIDFLLLNDTKKTAYLIELKGCHLGDAIEQLEISHEALKDMLSDHAIRWRIVSHSRTHRLKTNRQNKKEKEYKKKYLLESKPSPMEEYI